MADLGAARRLLAVALTATIAAAACSSGDVAEPTAAATATPIAATPIAEPTPDGTSEPTGSAAAPTATAAPQPTPTPFPEFAVIAPTWEPCRGSFECAELTVPVDHADPDGATMQLALIRVPAADPDQRIGSVLFNPGGPGGSGIGFLRTFLGALPGVERHFDIVSWDPRGVGESRGLRCVDDVASAINDVETPADGFADDLAGYVADNLEIGAACLATAGDLLDHVGTVATARDLDLIRRALGDQQLTYVGYSYGTRIGAVYAALFPDRIRALVLDGAFPPSLTSAELAANAVDLEATLSRIDRACALEPDCRVDGVTDTVDRLLDELDATTPGDPLGLTDRSALVGATLFAIYVPSAWQFFTDALADAAAGDIELVEQLAELWYDDDGDFSDIQRGSYLAIMCADRAYPVDRTQALDELLGPLPDAPVLGPLFLGATCEGWPVEGEALPLVTTSELLPVVVIGSSHDPATPLRWAQHLADDLPGASLVTFVGDGHTIVGRGNTCIDDLVERFLIDLERPPSDSVCRAPTGLIGVTVEPTDAGFRITAVAAGGPADAAGVEVGDVIAAVDGRPTGTVDALTTTAGQRVQLTVLRDGAERDLVVTAERRPWTLGE